MNKILILLFLTIGCAHKKRDIEDPDLVTVKTALDQAQMSYLKGCVDAYKENKLGPAFEHCVQQAKKHRLNLDDFMKN
jgi:hypothetical protein